MSKYNRLWQRVKDRDCDTLTLTFGEIGDVLGFEIDHSFLSKKMELTEYGYKVGKISMKNKTLTFEKLK